MAPAAPPAAEPHPAPPTSHPSGRLASALRLLAAFLLLGLTAHWGYNAVQLLRYPYEWSSMDGYFVAYGQRLLHDAPVYSNNATAPMGFEYVPGYLALLGPLNALFGPAVWVERALALALAAGIAAIAGHVVRRRTGSIAWGLACVGLLVAPPVMGVWYLVRGIDLLVLLVGLGATALLAESERPGPSTIVAAAILYALGFYCKQTIVFAWAAGAAIVWLRAPRSVPLFVSASVLPGIAIGLGLQAWSGGWFWDNAFLTTSRNPFSLLLLAGMSLGYLLLVAGLALAGLALAGRRGWAALRHPWLLYLGACVGAMGLAGKLGAAPIYFLPAHVALAIWVTQEAPAWLRAAGPTARTLAWGAAVVQCVVWAVVTPLPAPTPAGRAEAARLLAAIEARPGPVLVERADSFATLAGRPVDWEAVQLPILHAHHDMPLDDLLQAVREQRLAAILYSGQFFNGLLDLRRAIFEHYEPLDGFQAVEVELFYGTQHYTLLVPKRPAAGSTEPPGETAANPA